MGSRGLQLGFNFSFPCHQTGLDKVRQSGHRDMGEGLQPRESHWRSDLAFSAPRAPSFPGPKVFGAVVWKAGMWSSCFERLLRGRG